MGQDRQYNMTHSMGHMGYSRDCPLCPKGTMGLMARNTWDVPGIVPHNRTYGMAWNSWEAPSFMSTGIFLPYVLQILMANGQKES